MFSRRHRLCAAGFAVLPLAPCALAQPNQTSPTPPPSDARKEAAGQFAEGTRAFDAGDFTRAGEAFEAAYAFEHHEDPLWNAARAWHRAGDLARAANLYARYLREAPPNAGDRAGATAALNQLGSKLSRIEVHLGAGVESPRVDDVPLNARVVYVVPGMHSVRAQSALGDLEKRQVAEAGAVVSVLLEPSSPVPPASPAQPASGQHVDMPRVAAVPSSGWSPVVVGVEGGATLIVAGLATWSGLETLGTLHAFETTPTPQTLDAGRAQEVRTNLLIGASVGLAALTGLTAAFLVDWKGSHHQSVEVGLGLRSAAIRGSF
ncbi:MAG: hypothetical protein M3O46_14170 [Myxococcota bacterium]|nr:hypothetical protein [Myxococcota bacterium]